MGEGIGTQASGAGSTWRGLSLLDLPVVLFDSLCWRLAGPEESLHRRNIEAAGRRGEGEGGAASR
eukprot:scaffold33332_cov31-Tisochrysis_lutea.AAC.6